MKFLKYLLLIFLIGFAFYLGIVFNDIPNLKLNPEVRLFEPLTFLLTASIGILIPFFIKRWIDDSRQVKNNMIDELKDTLREVMTIKDKIRFCYSRGSILQSDKDEVVQLFEQSDIKITCLEQLFVSAFDAETKAARSELRQIYLSYWKFTTGSELMNSKFSSISDDFFRRHNETFMTLESKIKQTMNKVHRL